VPVVSDAKSNEAISLLRQHSSFASLIFCYAELSDVMEPTRAMSPVVKICVGNFFLVKNATIGGEMCMVLILQYLLEL
jgi:hypothetical protein